MDVLIVEDDQEQLDGIESILLEKYDHMNCIKATNYQQATQLMHANKIQLFLLDISLGDDASEQDGIALGTQIRSMQRYAKTPILYLTAYSMDAPRAIHATNCYDFLVKPYKKEDLLYTIDKLIHNRFLDVTPIELRDVNGIYFRVLPEKILYIEAAGKNLTIYEESNVINKRYPSERTDCTASAEFHSKPSKLYCKQRLCKLLRSDQCASLSGKSQYLDPRRT